MPAVPSSSSSFSGRRNSTQNAINTRANTTVFAFATITLPKTLSNKGLDGYGNTTADLSNLTSRSLSSSSAAGAATDGKNSTALETINIAGAAISASDAKLLARLIRSSSAANIKILKLARNAISQQALKYIFEAWKYNQTITTLSLARSGINDNTIKYISKVLAKNETIRELDLSSNRITAPGMEVLAEGLVYNRALVRLCLQSNNIKKAGAPFLARLLTKNKVLRHLNVGSNGLGSEGCVMIAEAVRFNRTLNSLSLDMNEMGPEAATAMAAALVSNRHLNYLYLPHNSIGDQGLVEICESLKRNRSLIGLDLELNHIENAQSLVGMTAMSEVLRTNRTLREINLAYNLFSGDAIRELMKGVAVNTTLESINFTNCGISTEGAMAIAEVLPSARGLQNLGLTSNPDIAVEGYWALSTSLAKNRSMKGIQLDYNSEDRYVLYEAVQRLLTRNFIWQQAIYAAACRILVLSRVVLLGRPVNQRLSQSQLQQQQQQQSRGGGPWSLIKKKVGLVRTNSSTSYSSLMTINKTRAASPDVHSGNASPLLLTVESMGRAAATASQDRDEREPGSESVQNLAHGNRPLTPTTSLGVLVPPGLGRDLDLGLGVRLEVMGGGTTSSRNSTSSRSNSIRRGIHPLDPGPVSPPSMASSPSFYNIDYQEPYNAHKVMANLGNMPYEIFETICAFLDPGRTMTIAQIRATIQAGGDRSTLVGYSTKDLMLERIFQSRYISPFGMRYSVKNGEERP
ncbi:hypothetical protein BGX33_001890 [Mortierella sp. NVP41]|nr:hypothetical protein BGX33_001890 [Mortierella sp. NVP41]